MDIDLPLLLPTDAEHMFAGSEIALVQLIITWAQKQRYPVLETWARTDEDSQLMKLPRRLYGLIASLSCAEGVILKSSVLKI